MAYYDDRSLVLALSLQLVHVLNMVSAEIFIYPVQESELVSALQERIELDTCIPTANQELLLEAGLALEPKSEATQCAVDYSVRAHGKSAVLWTTV